MAQEDWDHYFMDMADLVASKSKDTSTKVGCVIVGPDNEVRSLGYNDFPRGVLDDVPGRRTKPAKYAYTEHAERNAIYNAARMGLSLKNCRAYVPWYPCCDCARGLIQAGITELVCILPDFYDPKWGESHQRAEDMMIEADIEIRYYVDTRTNRLTKKAG